MRLANDRLMPDGCLRDLPGRIMEPLKPSPVLVWPFLDIPCLPLIVLSGNGEQWHTRLCGVSITMPDPDAQALAAWLALAQRLGCLISLDDQADDHWLVCSTHQIELVAACHGFTEVRVELERLDR